LIFSKLQGGYWPNVKLVSSKCEAIIAADANGEDVTPFLASGSAGTKRSGSPKKGMMSTAKNSQQSQLELNRPCRAGAPREALQA
jgi:hypothetical protein